MSKVLNILIPDGESIWTINVVQCLNEDPNINLFVLSGVRNTAVKYSKYISSFQYKPLEIHSNDRFDWINEEIDNLEIDIVLPIAEPISQVLISNRDKVNPRAKVVALASEENFKLAIYKNLLNDFLIAHDIPTPKSFFLIEVEDLILAQNNLKFPVLLKPIAGKGGEGIIRFDSFEELNANIGEHLNSKGVLIQELVNGYDIDCSVFCEHGEILAYTIQKGFLKGQGPFSPPLGIEFLENDEVLNITKKLMSALNWNGVAHIDLRYDYDEKNYKVLEINARFWGSLIASKKVGVNFPKIVINKTFGNNIGKDPYQHKKIVNFNGMLKKIVRNPLFIFNKKSNLRYSNIDVLLSDSKPHLFRMWEFIKRKF